MCNMSSWSLKLTLIKASLFWCKMFLAELYFRKIENIYVYIEKPREANLEI
jgi:hypothetical protein